MKVYISGALAGSKDLDSARQKYEAFEKLLTNQGVDVHVPHRTTDPERQAWVSADDVFQQDMDSLLSSDVMVAFLDEPSLGVGAEVALALRQGIRVVGAVRCGLATSRFLVGLIKGSPNAQVTQYVKLDDIIEPVMRSA